MKHILLLLSLLFVLPASDILAQSDHILWYNQPAKYFEESLVLGNGKMGATVFGGVASDKIYLNDATLWSGEPVDTNMNPEAYKNLPAIREALNNENYKLADSLNHLLQGRFSQSYAPLGTLFIDFRQSGEAKNYYRELNIADAISKVSYEIDGVKYTREYLVSYPDQVMAIKISSSQKETLNFDIKFNSLLRFTPYCQNEMLKIKGYAPVLAEPSYRGNIQNAVVFDENKGTRFTTLVKIKNTDGAITATDSTIGLRNASEAVIFVSIATSFNGFNKNPATEGLNDEAMAEEIIKKCEPKSFSQIRQSHLQDYHTYFNRVRLHLGASTAPDLPTDYRLRRYAEGKEDKNLEILYFQFGRYLLISGSRTKGVPVNLQGIWNPYLRPPWSSNYTVNINTEENYWLAENTNLSEMHTPLLSFIKNLSETGKITAKTFYGCSGWAVAHNSDIWALSNPVGDFGKGDPNWANWNMGGVWLSTHLWEHYIFTKDTGFLKKEAYPLMKGAALFCMDWLVNDKNGFLITSPSTSPENLYRTNKGYVGATLYGGTADLAMIRELLQDVIKAAEVLHLDLDFALKVKQTVEKLNPYQISKKGYLQEWYHDWEDQDPQHRHQSHLFGLYPGHQITLQDTPELAEACRKTLIIKGDESTGWSKGWRINLWARLGDGNHAYKMYRELLSYVEPDEVKTDYQKGGGTYPNLFDACPPFQIDGNYGGAAAVAEMLVQSNEKEIRLLPALPDAWSSGSVKGICARGGFVISMEWDNSLLKNVNVYSEHGGTTRLIWKNEQKDISAQPKQSLEINW